MMETENTFTTSEVANLAAIPVQTLRKWTGDFAEFLSSGANPTGGLQRRFTVSDVRILGWLRHRASGRTLAEDAQELRRLRDAGAIEGELPTLDDLAALKRQAAELRRTAQEEGAQEAKEEEPAAITTAGAMAAALVAAVQATATASERSAEAVARLADTTARLDAFERRLEALEASLEALKRRRWPWQR